MKTVKFLSLSVLASSFVVNSALAKDPIESYVARLSAKDHFSSKHERLTSPALIIRQDRANFHKFGKRDDEDESDTFFQNADNRKELQELLERGHTTKEAYRIIVNEEPLIRVNIYEGIKGSVYVTVLILSE